MNQYFVSILQFISLYSNSHFQVSACQKVFQAAHSVLLQDLKSCEPLKGRNVRSLKWLQPQFSSAPRSACYSACSFNFSNSCSCYLSPFFPLLLLPLLCLSLSFSHFLNCLCDFRFHNDTQIIDPADIEYFDLLWNIISLTIFMNFIIKYVHVFSADISKYSRSFLARLLDAEKLQRYEIFTIFLFCI